MQTEADSDKGNGSAAGAAPFDPELATVSGIQKRVDALVVAMLAKAVLTPEVSFSIKSQAESSVGLHWATSPKSRYNDGYEYFYGTASVALDKAAAYVAALPTPEQAHLKAFMDALGEAIEAGKKADINVEYVNPLLALMKKLSKNALEHRVSA